VKRISPATVTLGLLALVCGLVAAYIVRVSLEKPAVAQVEPPAPPAPERGVPVVVARWNLPLHHRVSLDDTAVVYVKRDSTHAKTGLRERGVVTGRITTKAIKAGQLLLEADMLGIGEGLPSLAERIPSGHRALTVQVDRSPVGSQKIEEGSFVDIALTVEGDHPDLGGVATRTLLRRVLVVDPQAGPSETRNATARNAAEQAVHQSYVTVAVPPVDANKLINAERTGKLSMTLCSREEELAADTNDSITKRDLLGLSELPPPPVPEFPAPAPRPFVAERWSGGKLSLVEISHDRVRESREVTAHGGKASRQIDDSEISVLRRNRDDQPQIATE
jgi:Flp pilus assembly protein CpaB